MTVTDAGVGGTATRECADVDATPARAPRDPWFDNARATAAVLIVLGHVLERTALDRDTFAAVWAATWPFRIPAYVLLAGWFSSARALDARRVGILVRDLLLVYLLFACVHIAQGRHDVTGSWLADLAFPPLGTWFLLSLFTWRLMLPLVARVPGLLGWAVAAAVLVGFVDGVNWQYSASHTVAMFPLFLLGARLRTTDLRSRLDSARARPAALAFLVAALVCGVAFHELDGVAFAMNDPYASTTLSTWGDPVLRLVLLAAGGAGAVALLTLVPRDRIPFVTYLGTGSMYVYVLHIVVLVELDRSDVLARAGAPAEIAVVVVGTVVACAVLASPPVRAVFRPIVQPRFAWQALARRRSAAQGAGRASSVSTSA